LGAGLIARALVRTRPFSRGEAVHIESRDPLVAEMTAAWVRSLGARVVESEAAPTARIIIQDDRMARRRGLGSHGRLAQAAVEVFQAIRAGVFDGVPLLPAAEGRL